MEKVYLTFPTDPETAYMLKDIAHKLGKTQPEFINEICKEYIENLLEFLKEKLDQQEKR